MSRRLLVLLSLVLASCLVAAPVLSQPQPYVEGKDYFTLQSPVPASGDDIEVVEAFAYTCPHCATLAPQIANWAKQLPEGVTFVYQPLPFGAANEAYARGMYAAQTLGIFDQAHTGLFDALHVEKRRIADVDALAEFYAQYGVSAEEAKAVMDSFAVDAKLARAKQIVPRYGVEVTPTMIVAGKYRVPAGQGGHARMLEIVDWLLARELAARGGG